MAAFDAVFVGSGINSLAGAALLSQRGWRVCVLEREDRLGGCLYTSDDLTLPGFTHEVLASWHPLWTGGGAYAELKDELDRRGVEYVNTDLPTGTAYPGRLGGVRPRVAGRERRRADLARGAATARPGRRSSTGSWPTPTLRSACSAPSCGRPPASVSVEPPCDASAGAGSLEFAGGTLVSCRDWVTGDVPVRGGARAPGAVGAAHRARARSGDLRLHDAGDRGRAPARRHAGAARRRPRARRRLAGIVRDAGGEVRAGADVERILVAGGQATGVRLAGGEVVAAERAVVAASRRRSSTGGCSGPARCRTR